MKLGTYDGVVMGATLLLFFPKDQRGVDGTPFSGELKGSEGSVVDHIGFSFTDLAAKMQELTEAGVEILQPSRDVQGKFKYGFVRDPWGTKIEVMQDPDLIGFHHIHVLSKNPNQAVTWYQEIFGGTITAFKELQALPSIRYGDMWLIVQKTQKDLAPTMLRTIDHLGWGFVDLGKEVARFKERGERLPLDIIDFYGTDIAFIESPDGALIEMVEVKARGEK
jgi:predicted enzyme related to lactoylglutathione lyase|tara:strand:+ start:252 stop:917 length:666 start_codon:yes stop_codon:yes gene_type:complete